MTDRVNLRINTWERPLMRATLIVLVLTLSGCLVDRDNDGHFQFGCWGDSNTAAYWRIPQTSWCDQVAAHDPAHWSSWNGGIIGLSADLLANVVWPTDTAYITPATDPTLDGIVIALGTNDVSEGRTPEQIIADLTFLRSQANDSGHRQVWIMTLPPRYDDPTFAANTDAVNAAIKTTFGSDVIDVGQEEIGPDGVHLTPAAETARANLVWSVFTH